MKRQNVIIVLSPESDPEVWGNFKKMCESKRLPYHSLKFLKFPITHNEFTVYKKEFL